MRKGMKSKIVNNDKGEFLGFNLGADYVSEHERGIAGINRAFGIENGPSTKFGQPDSILDKPKPLFGIDRRLIRILPAELSLTEHTITPTRKWDDKDKGELEPEKALYLEFRPHRYDDRPIEINRELLPVMNGEEITCAWSDKDFGIVATSGAIAHIHELHKAFHKKDIIIGIFGGGPFENGGLTIAIASRVPKETAKSMYDADEDYYNLKVAAEKTGIYQLLENAGKKYFACSPRWAKDIKGVKSAYDVVFWLNPEEQRIYNSGYFTVEDLMKWAKDEGPIPKKLSKVKS